ncbi:hypothetical protein [Laspinema olomoucense]|uniref:hypothetical protein n=1 Tax=Laspinema olomoucense TaxID=3231600 RepID=UPI0021BA4F9F|nr:hypothetical protein [Laspinema sp. D3c]MCT7992457.1 hypothetical protein [Laspinema sp. D3c]
MTKQFLKKETLSVEIPSALLEKARDAAYWTPGLTLTGLASEAIAKFLEELEQQRGESFPARPEPLKAGRPMR